MYGLEVIFFYLIRIILFFDVMFSCLRIVEVRVFVVEYFYLKDSWYFIEFTIICLLVFIVFIV